MEVFEGHRALFRPLASPAVALGNFDGVHLGHQRLFAETVAIANRLGGDAVVFTFEPHPARVLAPELAPALLTTRDRKLELMAGAGITACVIEPFTHELAALDPRAFVHSILIEALQVRAVVVGYDFTYGRKREGNAAQLQAMGDAHGFTTQIVAPVEVDGIVASSTKVRNFLAAGKVDGVRLLLGRNFDVDGEVVRGAGRGRTIGIPTANLGARNEALPAGGVYAVRARVLDTDPPDVRRPGVANLGTNPTFVDDGRLSLEVHLLDFDGDLYGQTLRVEFVERIRGERRFDGPDALVAQIHQDIATARELLARAA